MLVGRKIDVAIVGSTVEMPDSRAYCIGLFTLLATVWLAQSVSETLSSVLRQERQNLKTELWIGGIRVAKLIYIIVWAVILPLLSGVCSRLYVGWLIWPGSKIGMEAHQVWGYWLFGAIGLDIARRIFVSQSDQHLLAMRNVIPIPRRR